jgi:hypothetical protein
MTRAEALKKERQKKSEMLGWKVIRGPKWKRGDNVKLAGVLGMSENNLRHYFTGKTRATEEFANEIIFQAKLMGSEVVKVKVRGKKNGGNEHD